MQSIIQLLPSPSNHVYIILLTRLKPPLFPPLPTVIAQTLLCCQRMLGKKRNQEKSKHQLQVEIELSTIVQNCSLANALKQLDRKPCLLWKSEYEVSLHYTFKRDDGIQKIIFVNNIYPAKKRFLPYQERCNCSICKQHLLQCRHEIAQQHGQFKI